MHACVVSRTVACMSGERAACLRRWLCVGPAAVPQTRQMVLQISRARRQDLRTRAHGQLGKRSREVIVPGAERTPASTQALQVRSKDLGNRLFFADVPLWSKRTGRIIQDTPGRASWPTRRGAAQPNPPPHPASQARVARSALELSWLLPTAAWAFGLSWFLPGPQVDTGLCSWCVARDVPEWVLP
jgi:hypothetical protein